MLLICGELLIIRGELLVESFSLRGASSWGKPLIVPSNYLVSVSLSSSIYELT